MCIIYVVNDEPLNINFLLYSHNRRHRIPIEYINEELCVDIKRGCYVIPVNKFIECHCDGDIPRTFVIDLASAKLGINHYCIVYSMHHTLIIF
jgi:hypothetical protein